MAAAALLAASAPVQQRAQIVGAPIDQGRYDQLIEVAVRTVCPAALDSEGAVLEDAGWLTPFGFRPNPAVNKLSRKPDFVIRSAESAGPAAIYSLGALQQGELCLVTAKGGQFAAGVAALRRLMAPDAPPSSARVEVPLVRGAGQRPLTAVLQTDIRVADGTANVLVYPADSRKVN